MRRQRRQHRVGTGRRHGRPDPHHHAAPEELALRPRRKPDGRAGAGGERRQLVQRDAAPHLECHRRRHHRAVDTVHPHVPARGRLVPARVRRRRALQRDPVAAVRRGQHHGRRLAERRQARAAPGCLHRLSLRRDRHRQAGQEPAGRQDGQPQCARGRRPQRDRAAQWRFQHVRRALPWRVTDLDAPEGAHRARRSRWPGHLCDHQVHQRQQCRRACRRQARERTHGSGDIRRHGVAARRGRQGGQEVRHQFGRVEAGREDDRHARTGCLRCPPVARSRGSLSAQARRRAERQYGHADRQGGAELRGAGNALRPEPGLLPQRTQRAAARRQHAPGHAGQGVGHLEGGHGPLVRADQGSRRQHLAHGPLPACGLCSRAGRQTRVGRDARSPPWSMPPP